MWRSNHESGLTLAFHKAANVFAEHVELDIEAVANGAGVEVGDLKGVGDDPAGDGVCGNLCGGEGDAVQADGAFGDDEAATV